MITLEILQALLSADTARRQAAEAHFQSMAVQDRVVAWPSVWPALQADPALAQLAAVLWRRDILNCTNAATGVVATLQEPIAHIYCQAAAAPVSDTIRTAVGHCWAEVVAMTGTTAALEQTLQATQGMVSNTNGLFCR